MNGFDLALLDFTTRHALASSYANQALWIIVSFYLFKGFVLVPLLWWAWFRPGESSQRTREIVVATIASALIAFIAGRLLANCLPFRVRPIYNPALHMTFPGSSGGSYDGLRTWSSFPSDHAMVWMAVAAGIFIAWREAGLLAVAYAAVFVCGLRVYFGLHYPTDVLAGAVIGLGTTFVMTRAPLRRYVAAPVLRGFDRHPGLAYALAFMLCLELVMQFDAIRGLVPTLVHALRK